VGAACTSSMSWPTRAGRPSPIAAQSSARKAAPCPVGSAGSPASQILICQVVTAPLRQPAGLADGGGHGEHGRDHAERTVAVHHGPGRALGHDPGPPAGPQAAGLKPPQVAAQRLAAVSEDAPRVGGAEHLGAGAGVGTAQAGALERVPAERPELGE